jgi:NADH-quinone oxidoreductase subunit N
MMASANDLIVMFLALEVLSIALYVLAAFHRGRLESEEAGIKYFVLGAFSSAIFLYGVAWVYGATGTTSLTGIARFLSEVTLVENQALLVGIVLLLVGSSSSGDARVTPVIGPGQAGVGVNGRF